MNISTHSQTKKITISPTMTAWEYPVLDKALHGAVIELSGRYPDTGRVVNELCTTTLFMPCAPAWYTEQHREVE